MSKWLYPTILDKFGFLNIFHKYLKIFKDLRFEIEHLDAHHYYENNEQFGWWIGCPQSAEK